MKRTSLGSGCAWRGWGPARIGTRLLPSILLIVAASSAHAATYTVTHTDDSGTGSLRQAILDADASSGADTIAFKIPDPGPHTIQAPPALPTIIGSDDGVDEGSEE
jgi:hypothetical protein